MLNDPGTCYYCKAILPADEMLDHLDQCPGRQKHLQFGEKQPQLERRKIFQLGVQGRDLPEYWWLLEAPDVMSLKVLDSWLRLVWVECCGHMSCFKIDKARYYNAAAKELGGLTMRHKLGEVLQEGMCFSYEYDFGSTTELYFEVISIRQGVLSKDRIEPMARNVPPDHRCRCGQPAAWVCSFCMGQKGSWLCKKCRAGHDCGEGSDGLLPVVNSPRVGVCGYTG